MTLRLVYSLKCMSGAIYLTVCWCAMMPTDCQQFRRCMLQVPVQPAPSEDMTQYVFRKLDLLADCNNT